MLQAQISDALNIITNSKESTKKALARAMYNMYLEKLLARYLGQEN